MSGGMAEIRLLLADLHYLLKAARLYVRRLSNWKRLISSKGANNSEVEGGK
jgi:hypothetical protein